MNNNNFIQSLIIGVLVMVAIYIGLMQAFNQNRTFFKRSVVMFSASCGILVTLWLHENPTALKEYTTQIVTAGIAVLLAFLTLAKKRLQQ